MEQKCTKCGAPMKFSINTGKPYCSAKCWLPENQAGPMSKVVKSPAVETIVLNRTDRPHSYEFGKASARHKIYYGTIDELKNHIELLKQYGYLDEIPEITIEKH